MRPKRKKEDNTKLRSNSKDLFLENYRSDKNHVIKSGNLRHAVKKFSNLYVKYIKKAKIKT